MEVLDKSVTGAVKRPIKVLQFGEGNFLRGFVDYMIDIANEKGVFNGNIVIVKPIEHGSLEAFHRQQSQYTVSLRGIEQGEPRIVNRIVTSVADAVGAYENYLDYSCYAQIETLRFIVSNTTEAGIVFDKKDRFEYEPPYTYPGKLTKFLYERYNYFKGDLSKGLIILPCELIEDNGDALLKCVISYIKLWKLGDGFAQWLRESCTFCNTLVDRIITGYPEGEAERLWDESGYEDRLIVSGEIFALWVIESKKDLSKELPLEKVGLPVIFTDNQKPYREQKVRILNGAHTSFAMASYLAGNDTVLESRKDPQIKKYMEQIIFEEVIPTLSLPKEELEIFAKDVLERFDNPYNKHLLLSISLNSVSKWKARCLPSLISYMKLYKKVPKHLTFSLAALLKFYRSSEMQSDYLIGYRNEKPYKIKDDKNILKFFSKISDLSNEEYVVSFLSREDLLGEDMTKYKGLVGQVVNYLDDMEKLGVRNAMENVSIREAD